MTHRFKTLEEPTLLTRRAFTLDAALAILGGCVITITNTACGDDSPAPTPNPSDVSGSISANHGHTAAITAAQITTGSAVSLNIQGTATHPHTVSVSQSELTTLRNRQSVTIASSNDSGHTHDVTFTPA
jgi:hypothetical protein